jgi:hypothetical protein
MERSESIIELAKALASAQGQLMAAPKDALNPHFKSRYADLPAVWNACRKPLSDNGLSICQMPCDAEVGRAALETLLMHASGQFIISRFSVKVFKDDAQGIGSALTYLRRYALASIVGVVADDDDDGNSASGVKPETTKSVNKQPPKKTQPTAASGYLTDAFSIMVEEGTFDTHAIGKIAAYAVKKYKLDSIDTISDSQVVEVLAAIKEGKLDSLKKNTATSKDAA